MDRVLGHSKADWSQLPGRVQETVRSYYDPIALRKSENVARHRLAPEAREVKDVRELPLEQQPLGNYVAGAFRTPRPMFSNRDGFYAIHGDVHLRQEGDLPDGGWAAVDTPQRTNTALLTALEAIATGGAERRIEGLVQPAHALAVIHAVLRAGADTDSLKTARNWVLAKGRGKRLDLTAVRILDHFFSENLECGSIIEPYRIGHPKLNVDAMIRGARYITPGFVYGILNEERPGEVHYLIGGNHFDQQNGQSFAAGAILAATVSAKVGLESVGTLNLRDLPKPEGWLNSHEYQNLQAFARRWESMVDPGTFDGISPLGGALLVELMQSIGWNQGHAALSYENLMTQAVGPDQIFAIEGHNSKLRRFADVPMEAAVGWVASMTPKGPEGAPVWRPEGPIKRLGGNVRNGPISSVKTGNPRIAEEDIAEFRNYFPQVHHHILTLRNVDEADSIDATMQNSGGATHSFCVGHWHLFDRGGVIDLLEKKGYRLVRL